MAWYADDLISKILGGAINRNEYREIILNFYLLNSLQIVNDHIEIGTYGSVLDTEKSAKV